MNFYWNVTLPGPHSISVDQLFALERAQGTRISSNDEYLALAATVMPADRALAFWAAGKLFGVSSDTSER